RNDCSFSAYREIAHIRIRLPLPAEGRHRPVARDEADVVAQRKQALADRRYERLVIAARKIGAADRAFEQDVADHGELRGTMEEDDVARRVPRTVEDLEDELADRGRVALPEPAVGREFAQRRKAELHAVRGQLLDPEAVGLV